MYHTIGQCDVRVVRQQGAILPNSSDWHDYAGVACRFRVGQALALIRASTGGSAALARTWLSRTAGDHLKMAFLEQGHAGLQL